MSRAALDAAVEQYNTANQTNVSLTPHLAQVRATLAVAAALIAIAERLEVK